MRRFVGLELGEDAIPDETTILRFRHLLERHHLTAQLFDAVRALLEERRRGMGRYRVKRRGRQTPQKQRINRARSLVRSMVEQLRGCTKVRYRGLANNTTQPFTLFALRNLYRLRYRLCPALAMTR